jgi:hypothetical protein
MTKRLSRNFRVQQKSLDLFQKYDTKRNRFANYASHKVDKKMEDGLMANSDSYRSKVESRLLVDLGSTVEEKYGEYSAWKL